ncbi:MAG: hypothetical protein EBQ98_04970, partial [Actinobacteria bacterium]|nr:hypothetical protein [Actinomycetota bacterium]
ELAYINALRNQGFALLTTTIARHGQELATLRAKPALANPSVLIDQRLSANTSLREQLHSRVSTRIQLGAAEIRGIQGTLRALSPQGTLDRGYAIMRDANQNVIKAVGQVKPGEVLTIRISDGEFTVRATD